MPVRKGKRTAQIDIDVGKRVRTLRMKAGMSQTKLGDSVGLTFQQIQKYEMGTNRIAPSRLSVFAGLFKVPVATFFGEDNKGDAVEIDTRINNRARHEVMEWFEKLDSPRLERVVCDLLEELWNARK